MFTKSLPILISGGLILTTGGILVGTGLVMGAQAALPAVPPWLLFLGIGSLGLIGGAILLWRGKEATIKNIEKKLTLQATWKKHPWAMSGVAVGTGMALSLCLSWFRAKRAPHHNGKSQQTDTSADERSALASIQEPAKSETLNRIVQSVGIQSAMLAVQTLALPLLERLLSSLVRSKPEPTAPQSQVGFSPNAVMRSYRPRHNGAKGATTSPD